MYPSWLTKRIIGVYFAINRQTPSVGKWYNQEPSFCKPGYAPQWKQGTSPRAQQSDFFVQCQEVTYVSVLLHVTGRSAVCSDVYN